MKNSKKIIGLILIVALVFAGEHVYNKYFDYNFGEITEGKVYKSGVIPPDKIADYVKEYGIKTIVDFRHGEIGDALNPANLNQIEKEKLAVDAIDGVNYVHIPSVQIPTEENLSEFYKTLDNTDAYPVLLHCHHGTGRAMIYSSIYRIEYEDMNNNEARKGTRPFYSLPFSSFSEGKEKGDYLMNYKKRSDNK
ncbi:MAG: dual specificity protein phosphatase family protein [Flavobacteriaceae bacterium]